MAKPEIIPPENLLIVHGDRHGATLLCADPPRFGGDDKVVNRHHRWPQLAVQARQE